MTTPIQTFMANMARAVRNRETVTIGGGEFNWIELSYVLRFMDDAVPKLMPKPGLERAKTLLWDLPIHDRKSAESFLRLLDANDLAFHCDDDPAEIVGPHGLHLFNPHEVDLLRQRMAEVHKHHDDPCSVLLKDES